MQAQLEADYTTILSGGGPAAGNVILRDRIESGQINGPRVVPSGRNGIGNNTPETAQQPVRDLAEAGVLLTGEISLTPQPRPSLHEIEVLAPSGSTKHPNADIPLVRLASPCTANPVYFTGPPVGQVLNLHSGWKPPVAPTIRSGALRT